ncbi:uncharacterized protein LACBIDRAFT_322741 [Laccaria bicolor S238N-H82]|uniref:Predicted protein n=1 Tax=Laccaria bicolor (strain S238N-H82 / ATCC MYA-4686) TaxID=486041 RepID=B0CXC7_LACBS|nr:uncharacterized protein LACBIDRAFT_322741 [Laccaria bicolor S238N-H82]EDR13645.1 predicted protein [Laccaria bicolor S238N-H82]|eukprot:XP_001876143.1 predicted protein [Laccaria bicolor S238N-H82]
MVRFSSVHWFFAVLWTEPLNTNNIDQTTNCACDGCQITVKQEALDINLRQPLRKLTSWVKFKILHKHSPMKLKQRKKIGGSHWLVGRNYRLNSKNSKPVEGRSRRHLIHTTLHCSLMPARVAAFTPWWIIDTPWILLFNMDLTTRMNLSSDLVPCQFLGGINAVNDNEDFWTNLNPIDLMLDSDTSGFWGDDPATDLSFDGMLYNFPDTFLPPPSLSLPPPSPLPPSSPLPLSPALLSSSPVKAVAAITPGTSTGVAAQGKHRKRGRNEVDKRDILPQGTWRSKAKAPPQEPICIIEWLS